MRRYRLNYNYCSTTAKPQPHVRRIDQALVAASLAFKTARGRFPDYHRVSNTAAGDMANQLTLAGLTQLADEVTAFHQLYSMPLVVRGSEDDIARKAAGELASEDLP